VYDLRAIRALADPLRLRIIGALSEPRTTKQVAALLSEKPTKLYHHVETLERAGLIALKETRPNRGTVEKYYQAVAGQFRVASGAFSPGRRRAGVPGIEAMLATILETARTDVLGGLTRGGDAPLIGRAEFSSSPERARAIHRRLLALLTRLQAVEGRGRRARGDGERGVTSGRPRYALTIVLSSLEGMESKS
jgi:DNA-binding transcriptional ArsR family regulator